MLRAKSGVQKAKGKLRAVLRKSYGFQSFQQFQSFRSPGVPHLKSKQTFHREVIFPISKFECRNPKQIQKWEILTRAKAPRTPSSESFFPLRPLRPFGGTRGQDEWRGRVRGRVGSGLWRGRVGSGLLILNFTVPKHSNLSVRHSHGLLFGFDPIGPLHNFLTLNRLLSPTGPVVAWQ